MEAQTTEASRPPPPRRAFALWIAVLLALGGLARAAPLADQDGRLLRQLPTEDGYLMLTIARNIALGRGMTIAEGTIPTNGTQPLATFLYAGCFALVDGDRRAGVALVLVLELSLALLSALALHRLGLRALAGRPHGPAVASLAVGGWFASSLALRHSMNGLETGLYTLLVLCVALALLRLRERPGGPLAWAGLGALLGVAFWARNDAVLLCAAVGLAHLAGALGVPSLERRVGQLGVAALGALAVASPWLVFNVLRFGHLVPISGQAESLRAGFAENLALVAPKLFEYATLVAPLPSRLEALPVVVAATALGLLALGAGVLRSARDWPEPARALLWLGGGFTVLLAGFYGLSFGAGHFMSRYLFPASPFLALLWSAAVLALGARLRAVHPRAPMLGALGVAALFAAADLREYLRGPDHPHFQVVEWVERNVPEEVWVGAIQTGTLGFFHERTINLDGKVNPHALAARQADGIPQYVVDTPIQFLVDWNGIAGWMEREPIARHFELVLDDPGRRLAVLRRAEPPAAGAGAT